MIAFRSVAIAAQRECLASLLSMGRVRLTDTSSAACICENWDRAECCETAPVLVRDPAEEGREDGRELARELALQALAAACLIHCSMVCECRLRGAFSPK